MDTLDRDGCGKPANVYPLQKEELLYLKKMGLITNAGLVYFALRIETHLSSDLFIIPKKEFAKRWGIPENSLNDALYRLYSDEVRIESKKIIVHWRGRSTKQE